MIRILIVDDEKPICDLIDLNLSSAGYECIAVQNGLEAIELVEQEAFDLVLLDIMLPGADGYDVMDYIRPTGIPVIFITAKHEVKNRVKGLKLGADDYLVKPFDVVELVARVEAVLRRYNKADQRLVVGDVVVDLDAHRVKKAGRLVETLYEKVWEGEYFADSRTLDLHVQRLRRKLGWEHNLVAVYKVGYRLEV